MTCGNPNFFFGGPDTQTPLGVCIGKSRALHCEMHIEPLNYKTQNANASVNIYVISLRYTEEKNDEYTFS